MDNIEELLMEYGFKPESPSICVDLKLHVPINETRNIMRKLASTDCEQTDKEAIKYATECRKRYLLCSDKMDNYVKIMMNDFLNMTHDIERVDTAVAVELRYLFEINRIIKLAYAIDLECVS